MRRVGVLGACVALSLTTAGCSQEEMGYYREGVGPKLHWASLVEETSLLDEYVRYICEQADFAPHVIKEGSQFGCYPASHEWPIFVQAGMNDIDRRCDAFLSWVDYIRRSREHWLNQLLDTFTATSQIMSATSAGPKAMQIVTAAFGLGKNTFINSTERLLTLAENSTVQSVVLGEQRKFRNDLRSVIGSINNRPAAIHTLRNYLRICMPMTIEQQINSTVTIYQQSGTTGLNLKRDNPLLDAKIATRAPSSGQSEFEQAPGSQEREFITGGIGEWETGLKLSQGRIIQSALCVSPVDGNFGTDKGNATHIAIARFKAGAAKRDDTSEGDHIRVFADRAKLLAAARLFPTCQIVKDAYELGTLMAFQLPPSTLRDQMRKALRKAKAKNVPSADALASSELGDQATIRAAVDVLRVYYELVPGGINKRLAELLRAER